jgi:Spy/CpxP family protein refolding chaperone
MKDGVRIINLARGELVSDELREKQQEELKTLREEHRKKVMNILTDDQKKWLEENAPQRQQK